MVYKISWSVWKLGRAFAFFLVAMDFLLVLLMIDESFLAFMEICGNWVLLARDMGSAGQLHKISMLLGRLGQWVSVIVSSVLEV